MIPPALQHYRNLKRFVREICYDILGRKRTALLHLIVGDSIVVAALFYLSQWFRHIIRGLETCVKYGEGGPKIRLDSWSNFLLDLPPWATCGYPILHEYLVLFCVATVFTRWALHFWRILRQ